MITIYSYNIAEGTLASPTVEELPELVEAENVDLWVDLEAPTEDESEILSSVFSFHELAIEDCVAAENEEAKIDNYEDYLFLVFHSVVFSQEKLTFEFNELDIFFGEKYIVTYHKRPILAINQLRKRLDKNIDFMSQGTDEILHAIMDSIVDNIGRSFRRLERAFFQLGSDILSDASQNTFNNLFLLKRSLINLRRVMTPAEEVVEELGTKEYELIQEENQVYFQDIHDHMSTLQGLLTSYMDMIGSTMDSHIHLTTLRMTNVMTILTIITTIMMPLTLIASIYGMNIKLPMQEHFYAFPILMALFVVISVVMLWYFKGKRWF